VKMSLDMTADGLINALRWKRQDMLDMKRPDFSMRPMGWRGAKIGGVTLTDIEHLRPPRRRPLTKIQRRARLRAAERLAKALQ
jgi:hypothetical protein